MNAFQKKIGYNSGASKEARTDFKPVDPPAARDLVGNWKKSKEKIKELNLNKMAVLIEWICYKKTYESSNTRAQHKKVITSRKSKFLPTVFLPWLRMFSIRTNCVLIYKYHEKKRLNVAVLFQRQYFRQKTSFKPSAERKPIFKQGKNYE